MRKVRFDGSRGRDELVEVAGLTGKQHDLNDPDELDEPLQPSELSSSGETHLPDDEWPPDEEHLVLHFLRMPKHDHLAALERLELSGHSYDEEEFEAAGRAMLLRHQIEEDARE